RTPTARSYHPRAARASPTFSGATSSYAAGSDAGTPTIARALTQFARCSFRIQPELLNLPPNRSRLPGGTSPRQLSQPCRITSLPVRSTLARSASQGNALSPSHARVRIWLVFACAVSLLAGCSKPYVNAHIESVNAEYRQLEDYVYCLEDENARLQQEIDSLKTSSPAGTTPGRPASPARDG